MLMPTAPLTHRRGRQCRPTGTARRVRPRRLADGDRSTRGDTGRHEPTARDAQESPPTQRFDRRGRPVTIDRWTLGVRGRCDGIHAGYVRSRSKLRRTSGLSRWADRPGRPGPTSHECRGRPAGDEDCDEACDVDDKTEHEPRLEKRRRSPIDDPAPRATAASHRPAGIRPSVQIAARLNAAVVTAVRASPRTRVSSGVAPAATGSTSGPG